LKSPPAGQHRDLRDTLFGDAPLEQWLRVGAETMAAEPWASFGRAGRFMDSGDFRSAIVALRGILEMPKLESRHSLQSYHFLQTMGVAAPQGNAKDVLGVVVEYGMPEGLDLLAAWADHHARYYNYSGAGVVWERPNDALDSAIDDLLAAGRVVARAIGPWAGARPPAPPMGQVRLNLLTPSGLHFGQGPPCSREGSRRWTGHGGRLSAHASAYSADREVNRGPARRRRGLRAILPNGNGRRHTCTASASAHWF